MLTILGTIKFIKITRNIQKPQILAKPKGVGLISIKQQWNIIIKDLHKGR
jgi:hypothetical protein